MCKRKQTHLNSILLQSAIEKCTSKSLEISNYGLGSTDCKKKKKKYINNNSNKILLIIKIIVIFNNVFSKKLRRLPHRVITLFILV